MSSGPLTKPGPTRQPPDTISTEELDALSQEVGPRGLSSDRRSLYKKFDESRGSGLLVILFATILLILAFRTNGILGGIAKGLALIGFGFSITEGVLRLRGSARRTRREAIARVALILTLITWFVGHILPHGSEWFMTGTYAMVLTCSTQCRQGASLTFLIAINQDSTDGTFSGTATLETFRPASSSSPWDLSGKDIGNEVNFEAFGPTPTTWWQFKGTIQRDGTFRGVASSDSEHWTANVVTVLGRAKPKPGWLYWAD